jgi:NADPH:quinone reductase-like Zn-dependent oxidoreductase
VYEDIVKAIVRRAYGSPDVLELQEVEKPDAADGTVLVRVKATSVNAFDWHMMRGQPYLARPGEGFLRPKHPHMGVDAAGIVEGVDGDGLGLRPGDRVFGARWGAFAEYVTGKTFVPIPAGLTFEQAAAIPVAGTTALQALRDKGRVEVGQRVLVTGAGGGVGTFAVQIAKAFGAMVTAVTRPAKADVVRSIGAGEVIGREDIRRIRAAFDLVIDAGGYGHLSNLTRTLTPEGTLVLVGPGAGNWLGPILHVASATVRTRFGRRRIVPFLAKNTRDDLLALKELVEAGKLRPVVDRTYPLAEAADAVRYLESGQATGKVVISV